MTGSYMLFLVKSCLPEPSPSVETSTMRYLSQSLDGCVRFPWIRRGGAHESLSLLFQRDGVPPKMIVDGLKEQTLVDIKRKVAEAGCHLRQTET